MLQPQPAVAVQEANQTSPPKPHGSARQPELDALRGLLLVLMTLTHLPTHASDYTSQPLGFVSAAEGFIFISALLTGRIFGRVANESGIREVLKRLWARSLRLYVYHLFLLAVAFTIIAGLAIHTKRPALQGLLDFYLAHHLLAICTSVLLIYRPPLLDILPMYIIFLLETPAALYLGRRWSWKLVLIPSAAIWLMAQFGLRAALHAHTTRITGLQVPLNAMGAFDLLAWQFLWAVGIWIGADGASVFSRWVSSKATIYSALVVALVFFVFRHSSLSALLNAPPWPRLLDKWSLGALRLLDFSALAFLFTAGRSFLARYLTLPPLVAFGQASLEVFCAQLLFCFAALSLVDDGKTLAPVNQVILIVSVFIGLYLVASCCGNRKKKSPHPG
jgi:hypothetical protein